MERLSLFACCLLLLASYVHCQTEGLVIKPERTILLKLEGDNLQLNCIHTYMGQTEDKVRFLKDGAPITDTDRYNTKLTKKFEDSRSISNTTLTINSTELVDSGTYTCQTYDQKRLSSITIYIIKVKNNNANLPVVKRGETLPPVSLQCEIIGVNAAIERNFTWEHDGMQLEEGDKYEMFNNGTLVINSPVRADMGEYQCSIIFFPTSEVEKHTITPKPCALNAGPKIDEADNNKNMVQGDKLELKCKVTGYPIPTVSWLKDGNTLNQTTRIHVVDYEGTGTKGKLIIYSLEDEDEGDYTCLAQNEFDPKNATQTMTVRVKDKLAALWPFLGIVAEVIVLCAIILVYEKRRGRKLAEEEDAVDNNTDNTVDHKDVRHRRT